MSYTGQFCLLAQILAILLKASGVFHFSWLTALSPLIFVVSLALLVAFLAIAWEVIKFLIKIVE